MNAVTLTIPVEKILAGYELPEDSQLTKVRLLDGGKQVTVIVHSEAIHTPYDFAQDYDEWRAAQSAKPHVPSPTDVIPICKPEELVGEDEDTMVPFGAGGPFAPPPTGRMQTTKTATHTHQKRKPRV